MKLARLLQARIAAHMGRHGCGALRTSTAVINPSSSRRGVAAMSGGGFLVGGVQQDGLRVDDLYARGGRMEADLQLVARLLRGGAWLRTWWDKKGEINKP